MGPSAFALTRGRDAFIVDLVVGQLNRVTADAKRFVVARGSQRIVTGVNLTEQPLSVPSDCGIVTDDLGYCVTPLGDVYAVGARRPLLELGKLLEAAWDRKRNIGMVLNAKKELILVDLVHATARRLMTDTGAKPTCDATQPKDYACQLAFSNYNRLSVLPNFLSPKGDRWVAARRGSTFLGGVAQGRAERELGPIESFRWSNDGALLDGFIAGAWRRFDLVQGTDSQLGNVKRRLPAPLVEVEGKLALLADDDRLIALPNIAANDAERIRGVLQQGKFALLEAANGLPFAASELLLDRLSFVSQALPGTGRLSSGRELAARCLDQDLLRKFVAGEALRCKL